MRTLKFRIWDDILKILYTPEMDKEIKNLWEMPVLEGGVMKVRDEIKVMQFTGLQDKNGKEIYEGDIVHFARKKAFCKCDAELEYSIGKFCPDCGKKCELKDFITTAKIDFHKGSFVFYHWDKELKFYWNVYIAENYIKWTEVIGNIHENPELL